MAELTATDTVHESELKILVRKQQDCKTQETGVREVMNL